jgi:hypothetical protein
MTAVTFKLGARASSFLGNSKLMEYRKSAVNSVSNEEKRPLTLGRDGRFNFI